MTNYRYEFDRSAISLSNRLVEDPYVFTASGHHVLVCKEGLFYTHDVTLTNASTGDELVLGTDYNWVGFDHDILALTGYEACAGIQLKNLSFSGTLQLTAQLVGGPEGKNSRFAFELQKTIEEANANPNVSWAQVQNKPSHYPSQIHTHEMQDIEDIDKIGDAVAELTAALKDRRPMYSSVQHINEQQERLIMLLGAMRKSINSVVAVTGSTQKIADIENALNNIASKVDKSGNSLHGLSTTLGFWPLGSFSRINAILTYKGGGKTHSVEIAIASDGTDSKFTRTGELKTGNDLFNISVVEAAGNLRLEMTPLVNGEYAVKWLAII